MRILQFWDNVFSILVQRSGFVNRWIKLVYYVLMVLTRESPIDGVFDFLQFGGLQVKLSRADDASDLL